jgi:hypothetical protein
MNHERQVLHTFVTPLLLATRAVCLTEVTVTPDYVFLQLTTTATAACCPRCTVLSSSVHIYQRRVNPGLGFGAFSTAQRTIQSYEAMHMFRKGQIEGIAKRDILTQSQFIN